MNVEEFDRVYESFQAFHACFADLFGRKECQANGQAYLHGLLVPAEERDRARMLCMLMGPRTEQIPFVDAELCLGRWQRILLLGFDRPSQPRWELTLLG